MNIFLVVGIHALMIGLGILSIKADDKKQKIVLLLQSILIGTFYGLREVSVGHDTISYYTMYSDLACFEPGRYVVEPSFEVLVNCLRAISPNVHVFIWVLSMIYTGSLAGACYNYMSSGRKYTNLVYALLFCMPYTILMQINVVRQGIAFSILYLGLSLFVNKKYLCGMLVAVLGCSFHYSGFVILIAFLFFWLIKNWKIECVFTICCSILGMIIANTNLLELILEIIPQNSLTERLIAYVGEQASGSFHFKLIYYSCFFIGFSVILMLCKNQKNNGIYSTMAAILSVSTLTSFNGVAAGRFIITMDVLLPIMLLQPFITKTVEERYGQKWKPRYIVAATTLCSLMFVASLFTYSMKFNLNLNI